MVNQPVPMLLPAHHCALLALGAPDRPAADHFVRSVFRERYDARLTALPPTLFVLYGADDQILAVAGLRLAGDGPLFLEAYLDEPVEVAIRRRVGADMARAQIIEVGSLATRAPGYARTLIQSLTAYLYHRHFDWVVFTAVSTLRNTFRRLGLNPLLLCAADPARLASGAAAWGSYYERSPEVMYGDVGEGYRHLRGLPHSDPAASIVGAACAMGRAR